MTVKTQTRPNAGFILSEANFHRSREVGTVDSGLVLEAGTVLGALTSGGYLVPVNNDASDGSQTAVGILLNAIDTSSTGTNARTKATYMARDCEVNGDQIVWPSSEDAGDQTPDIADLKALGIIVRF